MRGVEIIVVVVFGFGAAGCDDSCPLPSANTTDCVEGGLAGISLTGTWTVQGTMRDGPNGLLGPPQNITRDVSFESGCGFGGEDFASGECGIDDTVAACKHANTPDMQVLRRELVVCTNAQGELTYFLSTAQHSYQQPHLTETVGVLTR